LLGPLPFGLSGPLPLSFSLLRSMLSFGLNCAFMGGALAFPSGLVALGAFPLGMLSFGLGGALPLCLVALCLLACVAFPLGLFAPFALGPGRAFFRGLFLGGPFALPQDLCSPGGDLGLSDALVLGFFPRGSFALGPFGALAFGLSGALAPLSPPVALGGGVVSSSRPLGLVRGSRVARRRGGLVGGCGTRNGSRCRQPRQLIRIELGVLVRQTPSEGPCQFRAYSIGPFRAAGNERPPRGGRRLLSVRFVFLVGLGMSSTDDSLHPLQQFSRQLRPG